MKRFLFGVCVLAAALSFGTVAALPQSDQVVTIPSGLVLEVSTRASGPAAEISLATRTPNGFWTSNIDRIKDFKPATPTAGNQVVNFEAILVDEKAQLKVSIFSGSRFREFEELIATYTLAVGESAEIKELAKFGYIPPRISLKPVAPTIASVPGVSNNSRSLKVTVSPTASTLPSFNAKIRNLSNKPVMGIAMSTARGETIHLTTMQRNLDGSPLIPPGATLEKNIKLVSGRDGQRADTFNIESVVFADGSFEGRVEAAAQFRVYWHTEKAALEGIVPVLRSAANASARPDLPALIRMVETAGRNLPRSAVDAMLTEFPDHQPLHKTFEKWFVPGRTVVLQQIVGALRRLDTESARFTDAEVVAAVAELSRQTQEWLDRVSK